jgi:hypothetical protein
VAYHGFRPQDATRLAPASVEYLWRNTGLITAVNIATSRRDHRTRAGHAPDTRRG